MRRNSTLYFILQSSTLYKVINIIFIHLFMLVVDKNKIPKEELIISLYDLVEISPYLDFHVA